MRSGSIQDFINKQEKMATGRYKFKGLNVLVTVPQIVFSRERTPAPAHWLMMLTLFT